MLLGEKHDLPAILFQKDTRFVTGTVINDKDFQKRVCLRQQAIDTSDDRSLFIIYGDNDGDLFHDCFPPSENQQYVMFMFIYFV
ncbi:MAG: hypothetical protein V8Q17_10020, partial [Acutalibacteraceae bacterium]